MEKRFNQNINQGMITMIEQATGKIISDRDKKMLARGADEIDLVRSGLEETMVSAFHQMREIMKGNPEIKSLRTAAFVNAIKKISSDYLTLGIFP